MYSGLHLFLQSTGEAALDGYIGLPVNGAKRTPCHFLPVADDLIQQLTKWLAAEPLG